MDDRKKNTRGLMRIIAFALLIAMLLVCYSYYIRPDFIFTKSYRGLVEEEAPIDVLFIGGSSTLVYWSPMLAYDRYGISSYSLSDSAMATSLMMGILEESRSFCEPELYVIDLRATENFERFPETYTEGYFRTYTDSLPYSWNRTRMINYASRFAQFDFSPQALYFDFIYYHGQWRELPQGRNPTPLYKGQQIPCWAHEEVVLNPYREVAERAQLSRDGITMLTDLLDYIEAEGLPVLCLLNAYAFKDAQDRAIYNSVFDILEERGIPYLDTNLYYEEMGLDGATDFYNTTHVNILGAEKYTDFVARWLLEHYELADRRQDPQFASWEEAIPAFYEAFDYAKEFHWDLIRQKGGEV